MATPTTTATGQRQRRNGNGANGNGANGNGATERANGANGDGANLKRLLASEQIERAIMAPRGELSDDLLNTTRSLTSMGLRVSVLPRLPEVVGSSVELDEVDGITLLGMRRFGLSRSSRAIKRCFDLVGAGLGLLVLSPFLAAIAIAIKFDSSGPVFFRQRRMGRDGVPFEMFKFRTMVDGAEAQKGTLAAGTRRAAVCSRSRTIRGSPASASASGRSRSMSCPSCSTCCAVTWPWSAPGHWCSTRTA